LAVMLPRAPRVDLNTITQHHAHRRPQSPHPQQSQRQTRSLTSRMMDGTLGRFQRLMMGGRKDNKDNNQDKR
jgi:hypothetical protein